MIDSIKAFFNAITEPQQIHSEDSHDLAISALLCEVCKADHHIAKEEEAVIEKTLTKLLNVDTAQAKTLLEIGKEKATLSNSLFDFTTQLQELDYDVRCNIIKAMWEVAYADNNLDPIEELIIRKASDLIYVTHSEFIRTKLSVINSLPQAAV